MNFVWNQEKINKLIELNKQDISITKMSDILEINRALIRVKLIELNMYKNQHNKIQLAKEQINFIKENAYKLTRAEVGKHVNCSKSKIQQLYKELGIIKRSKMKDWTIEEDERIIDLYNQDMPIAEIASHFPYRTIGSVRGRLNTLDCKYYDQFNWTIEIETQLRDLISQGLSYLEIGRILNCKPAAISLKCKHLNIRNYKSSRSKLQRDLRKKHKKKCFVCNKTKSIIKFADGRRVACEDCAATFQVTEKEKRKLITRIKIKIDAARKHALDKNLPHEITYHDILRLLKEQNWICAYSGMKMTMAYRDPNIFSIDRISSKLGYTLDNIKLVCHWANKSKMETELNEFIFRCRKIVEYTKDWKIDSF